MNLKVKNFLILTVAGIINAVGVVLFLTPLNLIDGGFSGTSFVLSAITPSFFSLSFWLIVLNFPFYLFSQKKLGFEFIVYSLFAIVIYSFSAFVFQNLCNVDFSLGSPIVGSDKLLASVFGGLLSGVGSGLVIRYGGALDGIEVLAVLFAKKLNVSVGTFVMCYNVVLFMSAVPVFSQAMPVGETAWVLPLYSIVAYAVGIKVVDFVVEGLDKGIGALIVTDHADGIALSLAKELGRGVTILEGKGFYSNATKKIIYVVINRFEMSTLRRVVNEADQKAFVSFFEVNETLGAESDVKLNTKKAVLLQRKKEIKPEQEKHENAKTDDVLKKETAQIENVVTLEVNETTEQSEKE